MLANPFDELASHLVGGGEKLPTFLYPYNITVRVNRDWNMRLAKGGYNLITRTFIYMEYKLIFTYHVYSSNVSQNNSCDTFVPKFTSHIPL